MMALLNKIPLRSGINEALFNHLRGSVRNVSDKDRCCVLLLDELALQPHLHYDQNNDVVKGFVETGYERSTKVADHALVFMIRGVYPQWKHPIAYTFCEGSTKTATLVRSIKDIIRAVHNTGLKIVAIVCDQGTNNVAAINTLINDTRATYLRNGTELHERVFEVDGQKIIPLYDPPHLLKGIRNNFLTKNISYYHGDKLRIGKWEHIEKAYQIDAPCGRLRLMKKLTDFHVVPTKIRKIKVSYCSQIFSNQVAAGIKRMSIDMSKSIDGKIQMDKDADQTAELLLFFNDLFDSVNGNTIRAKSVPNLRSAVTQDSRHIMFWRNAIVKLRKMAFLTRATRQKSTPISLKNWILTLENFLLLNTTLKSLGFNYFLPRIFNQDPSENFFGQIRQHGGRNVNLTCVDFINYYKTLLINNFVSSHSISFNCEDDNSGKYLVTLKAFLNQKVVRREEEPTLPSLNLTNLIRVEREIDDAAIGFVSGFIVKTVLSQFGHCENCRTNFVTPSTLQPQHSLTVLREYKEGKESLIYCKDTFFNYMKQIYMVIVSVLPKVCYNKPLLKLIVSAIKTEFLFNIESQCSVHDKDDLLNFILKKFCRLLIHHYCNGLNKILQGRNSREVVDGVAHYCKVKYLKSRKK